MPEKNNLSYGSTITFVTKELEEGVRKELVKRLYLVGEEVKSKVQQNISTSSRGSGPSKEGEYPHADTGRLRNTIFARVNEKELSVRIGTNLTYGLYLEYGTRGGRLIRVKSAKALSWIGQGGRRMFAKFVVQGAIRGRSFLRRTMLEMQPRIKTLLTAKMPDRIGILKVS